MNTFKISFLILSLICLVETAFAAQEEKSFQEAANPALQARIESLEGEVASLKEKTGYDKGFFIRTPDKDFELKFGLFSQFFYEYDRNEDAADGSTFGIRRARLLISGHAFNSNLTYMVSPEMTTTYTTTQTTYTASDGTTVTLNDSNDANWRVVYLWAQMKFADELSIRVGEFIPPMERFFEATAAYQEFGNLPLIATRDPFTPNYQLGIMCFGTINDIILYETFIVNGTGLDMQNVTKSPLGGIRLTYGNHVKPRPWIADLEYSDKPFFQVSGQFSYELADGNVALRGAMGDSIIRTGGDAVFKYRGFAIAPEFLLFSNTTQNTQHYAVGGQIGYFIIPHNLEVAVQGSLLRYEGVENDRMEYSGGFNYYFYGHPVKIQTDYSYLLMRQAGDDQNNHRIRIGLQMGFF